MDRVVPTLECHRVRPEDGSIGVPGTSSDSRAGEPVFSTRHALFCALALVLVLLPFLVVDYVPSADLPQHVSQINALTTVLAGDSSIYQMDWLAPNTLVYGIGVLFATFFPPILAGRMLIAFLCLLWTLGTIALAVYRKRSLGSTLLAAVFVFSTSLYWGLLSFMLGWPLFILWVLISRLKTSPSTLACLALNAFLLYTAHALWFLAAALWFAGTVLFSKIRMREKVLRFAILLPAGLVAAAWFFRFSDSLETKRGIEAPHWERPVYTRLSPEYFCAFSLGAIRGLGEPLIYGALGSWVALGLVINRRQFWQESDPLLVYTGTFFAVLSFILPDEYANTTLFAQRWLPPASILLLLGLPAPLNKGRVIHWYACLCLAAFSIATALAWSGYERTELSGFEEALARLPEGSRVLGLDYLEESDYVYGRPFIHMSAYAEVLKRGTTHFSFAEHPSVPLRFAKPFQRTWTAGLEWYPDRVQEADFYQFDYALISGQSGKHRTCAALPYLSALTDEGVWRLYAIETGSGTGGP